MEPFLTANESVCVKKRVFVFISTTINDALSKYLLKCSKVYPRKRMKSEMLRKDLKQYLQNENQSFK